MVVAAKETALEELEEVVWRQRPTRRTMSRRPDDGECHIEAHVLLEAGRDLSAKILWFAAFERRPRKKSRLRPSEKVHEQSGAFCSMDVWFYFFEV